MKNSKYLIVLSLIFFMISCEKDHDVETYNLGSEFLVSNNGLTSLDTDVTFSIDNYSKNLSEVVMFSSEDVNLGTITITDGAGSITLQSADLGLEDADAEANYRFDAVFDGKPFSRSASLTVGNPMHLYSPYIWAENEDGEMEQAPVTVYQNDDVQYIKYEIAPKRATVESVTVETKVGANGNYTVLPDEFGTEMDSLSVVGSDYIPNDTVYYRFTAKNGSREQVGELDFVVNTVMFPNTGSTHLDTTSTQGFDLVGNQIVPAGTDSTDLKMVHVLLTSIGFESNNGALFVAVDESVYENNNVIEVKALFDAGSQQSGFASVEVANVYVYKTMRGEEEHYGIIRITAAYLTQNGAGDYLEFEYLY